MKLELFLTYVGFSVERPERITEARWAAMLKWHYTRLLLGEPPIYPK